MLAIADARSTDLVLDLLADGIAHCPNVALARIWLVQRASNDRGEERWLQLAASAGNLHASGADAKKLDGRFARFEIGDRKIGRVAATGEGVLLGELAPDDPWIAEPAWIRSESIRAFAAQPLIARGETLGVLGVFDRRPIPASDFAWLRTFADHAALAISNARAFEEISQLKRKLELENDYLREEVASSFGDLLGGSPALGKVLRQIEMVAPTEASVLVLGESGVGKELVAHAVHERSARRGHPLIKVNCGAVPGELFESEFFGHVRGAFTGAARDRVGRFELADGGTLFLDEVGEIPLAHQPKLLRVLQEGTFERVGDGRTRKADVRLIAATNRDLAEEVARGRFRADLYYRLSVFPIEVPPLRARREDVPMLAQHFVKRSARRLAVSEPRLTQAQARELQQYDWPGNVRELQHVVERAVILSRGGSLRFPDLGGASSAATERGAAVGAGAKRFGATSGELPTTIAELHALEKRVVAAALERASGKISGKGGAAELLGVPPTTLESKLRAMGIDRRKHKR
ncbi:MAG: sigma 54-interacting transcriptional regulator [Planctomycetes bacterium]|nr:sigma 54-interacting transcriptional regulator [Planctomycetota bacterium]